MLSSVVMPNSAVRCFIPDPKSATRVQQQLHVSHRMKLDEKLDKKLDATD